MKKQSAVSQTNPGQKQLESLARLPDMNPGPVMETDRSGIITLSNKAARKIFGKDLDGSSWLRICPGMTKKTWKHILVARDTVTLEPKIGNKEFIFYHKNDNKGGPIFIYGADVSERKQAERKLRESDELVRLLLNSTTEGTYGIDLNGNCNFANQACLKLLGFNKLEDLLGKQLHPLIHRLGADKKQVSFKESRIYKAAMRGEGTHIDDENIFRSDNTSFPAEYWSSPVRRDGQIIGCVVNFRDISDRKDSEILQEAYTNALAEIASFPEMNPGPVLRLDATGKILRINEAAHSLFGKEHMKSQWNEICPDLDDKTWRRILENDKFIIERHIGDYDFLFTHRRDFDNDLVFVFGTNITEQKQAERALQQAEKMAALGKLSAGLAHQLNNPAAAAVRAAGQLTRVIECLQSASMELQKSAIDTNSWILLNKWIEQFQNRTDRTVTLSPLEKCDLEEEMQSWLDERNIGDTWELSSILVTAGLNKTEVESLAQKIPASCLKEAVIWLCRVISAYNITDTIRNSTRSISELVDVVKSYSHMDEAPHRQEDIHNGIEDTITLLANRISKNIRIERHYSEDLPLLEVKGTEINQVWMNLIENAIDAMHDEGILTIRTLLENNNIIVEICDSGGGIPKKHQARIFEPFFTTKDTGKSRGLSLNVVHRIITGHFQGKIDVLSKPGQTVFRVLIPLQTKKSKSFEKNTV